MIRYARWVAAPGNAPDARYTVHHDGGATVVAVDQRHQSGEWMKLGSFAFAAGAYKVELSDRVGHLSGHLREAAIWGRVV